MRIYVVGSISAESSVEQRKKISDACRTIGKELAEQRHEIVVGSGHPDVVERYIVEGANNVKRKTRVSVYHPEGGERREGQAEERSLPFANEDNFNNISFAYQTTTGTWHTSQLQATQYADAVIAISNAEGTEITGHYAFLLEKALLPIPIFGGTAKELWNKYKHLYLATVKFRSDENRFVFNEWASKSPSHVMSALNKIAARNPFSKSVRRSWPLTLLAGLGLLSAWWIIFWLGQNELMSRDIAVFATMMVSAIIGTALRQILRIIFGPEKDVVDTNKLIAEAVASSILAFGFLMFFYLGTIVIVGAPISVSQETDSLAATGAFRRITFAMTVIGMAAGFLLEDASKMLAHRLSEVIRDQSSRRGSSRSGSEAPSSRRGGKADG
jgi:hypothetical protein